jgi:hypothetical protein
MTKITNKVGLEAEVFVRNSNGELVIASKHKLPSDDFCLLGEIRGEPGETPAETVSNFMKAYYDFVSKAAAEKLTVSMDGGVSIPHTMYVEVMKLMGTKEWPECLNIYGTDITEFNDSTVDKTTGKIVFHNVSCGLHIHFSSSVMDEKKVDYTITDRYELVKLPLAIGTGVTANIELYQKTFNGKGERTSYNVTATASRITKPVIKHIVKDLDDVLLPSCVSPIKTKYRQPGFYELKDYGFEYRSLPMTQEVFNNLFKIATYAFGLLKEL